MSVFNPASQVLQAAEQLVAAFAANDTEAYFAAFSADASFVFHTSPETLPSRAAYRALWEQWQSEGFRVLACQSSNVQLSLHGELAIFIHDVDTHLQLGGERLDCRERETIVFHQQADGRWLACHEHLSPRP